MSKKSVCLAVIVLLLCLASISRAIVIGDFENNMDGWVVQVDAAGTEASYSETGATLNDHSLKLVVPEGGYRLCLLYDILAEDMVDAFRKARKISVDVTRLAGDWTVAGADRHDGLHMVVNAGGDGWSLWEGVYEGWWDPEWVGDNTQTVTWDYSEWIPQIQWDDLLWLQFDLVSNYDGYDVGGVYYLDNIQLFGNLASYDPNPPDGATDVKTEPTLSWKPGANADSHILYLGADFNDVNDVNMAHLGSYPNVIVTPVAVNSYEPGTLEFNVIYHWRVDDVNAPDIVKGDVWSFTTGNYVTVDDFEDYNDYSPNRIFETWIDGYGYQEPDPGHEGNGTGSTVGYLSEPYAERTIVHGGEQSMPLGYDNSGSTGKALYSETERTFDTPQDWTAEGARALTLWFYGDPNNDANATEQFYVKVNSVKAVYTGDVSDIREVSWHAWDIPLKYFSDGGVDLTNVTKVAIGLGDEANMTQGGSGLVFIDDIWLYLPRCILSERSADFAKVDYAPAGYVSGDCMIDYRELEIMARDWLAEDDVLATTAPGVASLVAYYPLDEGTGTTAADASGNSHDGTLAGNAAWVSPGVMGNAAAYIDGGEGSRVGLGTWDPTAGTGQLTLSIWAKWAGPHGASDHQGLIGKRTAWAATDAMRFFFEISTDAGNVLSFRQYSEAGVDVYSAGGTMTPHIGRWAHTAVTFDGTTARIYLNGKEISSGPFVLADRPDAGMAIGNTHDEDWSTETFYGDLDEARIYNRALSPAEIAYLADTTPDDGQLHVPVPSPAELYEGEAQGTRGVNFKDFAVLMEIWLQEQMWP